MAVICIVGIEKLLQRHAESHRLDVKDALESESMEWKVFLTVFGTVFVAELGDKTQLATLLFAADKTVNKWLVFAAASFALVAASALSVFAAASISHYVSERMIHSVAGVGFIAIGTWTLIR